MSSPGKQSLFQYVVEEDRRIAKKFRTMVYVSLVFLLSFLIFSSVYISLISETSSICKTQECLRSAANLRLSMNRRVNPCSDFYEFACGNWHSEHPQHNVFISYDWFKDTELRVYKDVRRFLGKNSSLQSIKHPKPVLQVKEMYAACKNIRLLNDKGLTPLKEILRSVGLPAFPTYFSADKHTNITYKFNWIYTLHRIKTQIGKDVLIGFQICSEPENSSVNRLVLGSPEIKNPFVREVHAEKQSKYNRFRFLMNPYLKVQENITVSGNINNEKVAKKDESTKTLNALYADIMRIFALKLDCNDKDLYQTTKSAAAAYLTIHDYISSLEAAKDEEEDSVDIIPSSFPEHSVYELQAHTDRVVRQNNATPEPIWKKYLEGVFEVSTITLNFDKEKILIFDSDLKYLSDMVAYVAKTPPMILELYLWFQVVEVLAPQTTSEVRLLLQQLTETNNYRMAEIGVLPRSLQCAITISEMMDMAVGFGLADTYNLNKNKLMIKDMLDELKQALGQLIDKAKWMDSSTKLASHRKITEMGTLIGLPDAILKGGGLAKYYEGLEIDSENHLRNMVNIAKFKVKENIKSLRHKSNYTWEKNPLEVNAFHTFEQNTITVPIAIMQYPFINLGLDSLNYGALGTVLGHELAHGFDNLGRNFDNHGNLLPWWSKSTIQSFEYLANCFEKEYSNMHISQLNLSIDGAKTLGENIADNAGLREAYLALELHLAKTEPELKLPGLEQYTSEQMFFLSFGNLWCRDGTDESLREELEDVHSPLAFRVFGALRNNIDFAKAWNCPFGSRMNPSEKCVIY